MISKINFYKYRIYAFVFSIILTISSMFLFIKNGLNLGIDFKGGVLIEGLNIKSHRFYQILEIN